MAIEKIKNRFKKFNSDTNIEIDKISELDSLLLKIGSSHRWKGLKENIEDGDIKDILKFYDEEIIIIRNKFAHAVLEKNNDGKECFKNKTAELIFDEAFCKKIRQNIIRHQKNLDNIKKHLK